jgi:hypothetical protein
MQQMYTCPNCQAPVVYGQSACGNCGAALDWGLVQQTPLPSDAQQDLGPQQMEEPQIYACPNCMAQIFYGQSACSNCGAPLDWSELQQTPGQRKSSQYQQQKMPSKTTAMRKKKRLLGINMPIMVLIIVVLVGGGIAFALNSDSFFASSSKPPDDQSPAGASTEFKKPPAVNSFSAEPSTITQGQEAALSWDVSGAASVSIDQDIGTVSSSGTQTVSPDTTTTYHLTATNSAGPVSASFTITVKEPPEPAVTSFSASPSSIAAGESATLQWKVARASYVNIDQGIGIVTSSGTQVVTPTKTTTYTITATNAAGAATASTTITVAASGAPVINSFTADPATIEISEDSTLEWDVSGATSISIDQDIGTVLESGTKKVYPAETITYTLTARNNIGSVTASATVAVASGEPKIISFEASSEEIFAGQYVTLSWTISGATLASIDNDVGTVSAVSGTAEVKPSVSTTYTLTATNSYGPATESVTVTIISTSPPVIHYFNATTYSNGSSTLSWNISGATLASIDHDIGDLKNYSPSNSVDVHPTVTTIYTLTAHNSNGDATKTVTVTVP